MYRGARRLKLATLNPLSLAAEDIIDVP